MLGQQGVGSVSRVLHSRIFSPGGNLCGNKLAPLHPHQAQILLPELCFSHLWSWTIGEDFIFNEWISLCTQGNWLSPIELFSFLRYMRFSQQSIPKSLADPFIADIEAASKIIWALLAIVAAHPLIKTAFPLSSIWFSLVEIRIFVPTWIWYESH